MITRRKITKKIHELLGFTFSIQETNNVIYLMDWKSCILYGHPISSCVWLYGDRGPVSKIKLSVQSLKEFFKQDDMTDEQLKILEFVLKTRARMPQREFNRLIFSTYPMYFGSKKEKLELLTSSEKYLATYLWPPKSVTNKEI
jgi:hypothetical protein